MTRNRYGEGKKNVLLTLSSVERLCELNLLSEGREPSVCGDSAMQRKTFAVNVLLRGMTGGSEDTNLEEDTEI